MIRYLFISLVLVSCNEATDVNGQTEGDKDTTEMKISDSTKYKSLSNKDQSVYREVYPDGAVKIEGQLKDGKRNGVWKSFYDNGNNWSETYFLDGKKNGHSITWYKNGVVRYVGEYKNDKKTGEWKFYDKKGELVNTENF